MTATLLPDAPGSEPPGSAATPVPVWAGAVSGAVAAASALAAGEVPSAVAGDSQSLVTTVGNQFIDSFAAGLKDLAVALFGTNDKVALVVGIVSVSIGFGAALGAVARSRPRAAELGLVGFGLVGLGAALTDPQASATPAVLGPVLAVVTGIAVLRGLMAFASGGVSRLGPLNADPTRRQPDRRAFLAFAGAGAVGAAAVGAGGRSLRNRTQLDVDLDEIASQLPDPVSAVAIPPTGVDVDGVSPYVTPTADFYRIDTALSVPRVDPAGWSMRIDGLVDRPYELSYEDLLGMDMVETPVTLQCVSNEVGGDLVGTATWLGVPLAELLDRAGVRSDCTQVVGRSVDGFTVGFPTANVYDGRTALVAVGMNGAPLPPRHGFPARLVVSGLYGYVSATKWLSQIELTRFEDFDAYWIPRGWAKVAPIKPTSRIDVPRSGAAVPAGTVPIAGVAWSPSVGIAAVDVRIDGGEWTPARLGRTANEDTWVQWVYSWPATPGSHRIEVRCTDSTGAVQTGDVRPPAPDGATGWHAVEVDVR